MEYPVKEQVKTKQTEVSFYGSTNTKSSGW